ncbi:MAG: hypothetical protein CL981_00530 [Euryarchaeota archaeon]|nr:hypothetical protein [Euryarchaeota archaeon]
MEQPTPEQKTQQELNERFHASMINDEWIRTDFIEVMTCACDATDAKMESADRFIIAVDYMLATLGYGICDLKAEGGPAHICDPKFLEEQDS